MSRNQSENRIVSAVLFLGVAIFAVAVVLAVKSSFLKDNNSYLPAHAEGRWIKLDEPFRLNARSNGSEMTLFRRLFELDHKEDLKVHLRAYRGAGVWIDGMPVRKFDGDMNKWREEVSIDLPGLEAGKHELKIAVINENAHPVLLVWAEGADLDTPDGWEAGKDDFVWNTAADAARPGRLFIGDKFMRADLALLGCLPYMLPLFLLTAVFFWMRENSKLSGGILKLNISPQTFRFVLLFFWTVLSLNNFHDLPLKLGMDSVGHFKYIEYVGENLKLPSPIEGWQMFQPPLYYIISAVFYKVLLLVTDIENTLYWLRIIPLLCGAGMIEISYRCAALLFKENRFLQITATLFGGFMPMNFAMAQFWGNEPLAAVFSALTVLMTLRIITDSQARTLKQFGLLGVFCGCAILSKATAVLLIPLVVFFILLALIADGEKKVAGQLHPVAGISLSLGVTALTGGWYYLRNGLDYGKPFIGGWDKIREIGWWQDHGYRIWEHFSSFGTCLLKPVYSTVNGIWDGLYATLWLDGNLSGMSRFGSRPPWNDELMVATSLLALVPSLLILAGIARTFTRPSRSVFNGFMFMVGCVVVYFTAVTYLYLNLPVYSTAKASYTMGLLPCYGALAAAGIQPLLKDVYIKSLFCGFMAVWGSTVYLTYLV